MRKLLIQLMIFDEATLNGVGKQHRAGAKPTLPHHGGGVNIQDADLARENNQTV